MPQAPSPKPPGFGTGFALPAEALTFLLSTRGVKRVAVLPLIMNVILYVLVVGGVLYGVSHIEFTVNWNFWGSVGSWLSTAVNWSFSTLKWLIALPLLLITSYYSFTIVGMVLASPFNDMLSERVERLNTQSREEASLGWRLTGKAMLFSLMDSMWIIARQLFWSILVLPLLFIPIVGWIPLFLVTGYFTGLGYYDIPMARSYMRHFHKRPVAKRRFWQIFGLGIAMEMLFLIPFVGLLMLPLGVTAGTLAYCKCDWEKEFDENGLQPPPGYIAPKIKPAENL